MLAIVVADDEDGASKKSKDARSKKKKSKYDVDHGDAFEDSDDGDQEDREVDYMSDESSGMAINAIFTFPCTFWVKSNNRFAHGFSEDI